MVRNYIRKTTRGNWSEESKKLAILAVKNDKLSYQKAADQYAVPKIALFRHVKNQLKLLGPTSSIDKYWDLLSRCYRKILKSNW